MKLFFKGFIFLLFFFLFIFSGKAQALQTPEIFSSGTSIAGWETSSDLFGAPNSTYATKTTGTLGGYWYFSDSLNIPLSATIKSLVFNIYAQSSGNSSGVNGWSVYLNGASCSSFPNIVLGNGVRTVTIDATNCTGSNDFADVVQANKGVLNMSSSHVVGYSRNSGSGKTYIWDSVGVYATYELPDPIPAPTPPSVKPLPGSVWEWANAESLAIQKEGLIDIVEVAIGGGHNLALKKDGTVWSWGNNNHGQLGIGTTSATIANPVQVKDADGESYLTNVKAISAGDNYSMALKNDGTVWIWGYNGHNARGTGVGDNNDGNSKLLTATQVKASNGFSQITAIAAGNDHSIALKSDGSVFTWGWNDQGQTGTGHSPTTSIVRVPGKVMDDAKSVAAGSRHTLVAKDDGTVWGWGRLDAGQLGAVTNDWASSVGLPVQIPGINGIKSVYAENNMSMAISEDNKIFEWGSGRDYPDRNPRQVPDLENVLAIAGGRSTGAAIKEDGVVWTFDANYLFVRPVPGLWNIGSISMGAYLPNLAVVKMSGATLTPTPTEIPTPTPTVKTPLVLIPGVAGSELKTTEPLVWNEDDGHGGKYFYNYTADEKVWINSFQAGMPGNDDYFDILRLNDDGQDLDFVSLDLAGTLFEGYNDTVKFLTDNGYEMNKTLFTFPYDWRKDLTETFPLLDRKINEIKQETGSGKVDILAHSMGGLVARNYISNSARAENVGRLITLGTPYLGSVDSLKNLRFGGCLTKDALNDLAGYTHLCLGLTPSEVKDVLLNMTGAYELIPSRKYFDFYNGEGKNAISPYRNNGQELDYEQIKTFLTNLNYNTGLFGPSELFHVLNDQLAETNGVKVVSIVGSGLETLGQISEKKEKNFLANIVEKKDGLSVNGDGTVPLFSASLIDPARNLSLLGEDAEVFYVKQKHGKLIFSGPALNLVKNILSGDSQLPTEVLLSPYKFSGHEMSVYSPVNIHAYDSLGNHTGPTSDGDFEENIPGSSYDTLDDSKFIFLPDDGVYKIEFEATDKGSFDFKIRNYIDDEISNGILYKDIPLTALTKAQAQFDTSSIQPPIIFLDEDGDGAIDQNINFSSTLTGDEVYDGISPQTNYQIYGTLGSNGWFKSDVAVTLIAQDDTGGSGILKTEYSLDNGETENLYTGPFIISSEKINKLRFRSVDNAGNGEDSQEIEIKIDKTAPEAKIFVDQDKRDIVAIGLDTNPTTVAKSVNKLTRRKDDAFYVITDLAGNSTELDVRDIGFGKLDTFRIYSIRYNNDKPKIVPNNLFSVVYGGWFLWRNVLEQSFVLRGEIMMRIRYDSKRNRSAIIVRERGKEKVKETRSGLVLLELSTDKGQLQTNYQ